ncbi:hypothetical protein OB955_22190 [Halobacteria archaeon AArc-m2/3/4]|uniref:GLUG domain-containing protein n=1 Tax=Natronoglomus mannanivorans TaxID=2979990 RepID=A0ABT2QKL5_9EURY|nr:hypothetical protein [Halobacteria archaeon AArc-m2/3/4]
MTGRRRRGVLKAIGLGVVGAGTVSATGSVGASTDAPDPEDYETLLDDMDGTGSADDPYVLTTVAELQAVDGDRSAHYELGADIDASETENWNDGAGFEPLGDGSLTDEMDYGNAFGGTFDGNGYEIRELCVDRPERNRIGLFELFPGSATVENVTLVEIDVTGAATVGGLVGSSGCELTQCHVSGTVAGRQNVGGLVGRNSSTIADSDVTATVTSENRSAGGLVALNRGTITRSFASGDVSGEQTIGGLVGRNESEVTESYATGDVTTGGEGGGLVGMNTSGGSVTDSYATGNVDADVVVGGLVGQNGGDVGTSYAVGPVTGGSYSGGLVGMHDGDVTDSYCDEEASGSSDQLPRINLTSSEMTGDAARDNMDGFDFDGVWRTVSSPDEYPVLGWQVDESGETAADHASAEGTEEDEDEQTSDDESVTDDATEANAGTMGQDSDDGDSTTDDDGQPGPGIVGALATLGGVTYLLERRARDAGESDRPE